MLRRVVLIATITLAACLATVETAQGRSLKQTGDPRETAGKDSALYFTVRFPKYDKYLGNNKWNKINMIMRFKEAMREMLTILGLKAENPDLEILHVAKWGKGLIVMAKVQIDATVDSAMAHTVLKMNQEIVRRPFDKVASGATFKDPEVGALGTKYAKYVRKGWVTFQLPIHRVWQPEADGNS